MSEYPKCLLRDGSAIEWDGKSYDYLIVEDADAEKSAKADGWKAADRLGEAVEPRATKAAKRK